jgi:hypothetical protein
MWDRGNIEYEKFRLFYLRHFPSYVDKDMALSKMLQIVGNRYAKRIKIS